MTEHRITIKSVSGYKVLDHFFDYELDGWMGSDVCHSIILNDKKILWLFGDTLIGRTEKKKRGSDWNLINNSVGIMELKDGEPNKMNFFWQCEGKVSLSFFNHPDKMIGDFIWPTNGIVLNKKLYIFAMAVNATLDNSIDVDGTVCLKIDNYLDNPMNWKTEYWDFQFSGGVIHAALYSENGFLYFLGFHGKETSNHMILGRMEANELSEKTNASRIEFFQKNKTWDNNLRGAKPMFKPCNTESNIYFKKDLETFFTTTYTSQNNELSLTWAKKITGPWSAPLPIYTIPVQNKNFPVNSYAMRIHPWISDKRGKLIISYATNEYGGMDHLFTEEGMDIYRPYFIEVELS